MKVDFTVGLSAVRALTEGLRQRLTERQHVQDARVELALAAPSNDEVTVLRQLAEYPVDAVWGRAESGSVDFQWMASIPRLLDKQLVRVAGQFEEGHPAYAMTPFGRVVAGLMKTGLRKFNADLKPAVAPASESAAAAV